MDKRVGVAVIGAGYWGKKFVTEYLAAERKGSVKLLKVCDPSVSALSALLITKETATVGQTRLTQDISEVIHDPEISAIHIATPNSTHFEIAKTALEAGKNVLLEKPMTLRSRESYELVNLARANGLVIHVGHIFRFNAALRLARQIIERGDLGRIFYVRIQWTDQAFFPDRDIIFDLGPHPVDILNQLLGAWPEKLSGMTRGYRGDRGEVAYVIGEFPNDIFAHVELSWLHPNKVREVTIVGSAQTLVIDCLNQRVFRSSDDTREELPVSANNTMESEIDHFIDSIVTGDVSSESGLIGAHTVEVLESVRSSMWDRPLPVIQIPKHGAMDVAIHVLQMANGGRITSDQIDANPAFREKLGLLLQSGLIRRVTTGEDISYEATDAGSSFLGAYQGVERSLGASPYPVNFRERRQPKSNDAY
jgi:UDP-N-acetylglucosamine 3-dehydrogenase